MNKKSLIRAQVAFQKVTYAKERVLFVLQKEEKKILCTRASGEKPLGGYEKSKRVDTVT